MKQNTQKILAHDYAEDSSIFVHSIFKTIQGEGPFTGERALFIRLFGCNLQCKFCDTEYTSKSKNYTPIELLTEVKSLIWPQGALIVLTGGEPFRQNVVPAISLLLQNGWRVQVETNGVLAPPNLGTIVYQPHFGIVCSPKTSRICPLIMSSAIAFKYVVQAGKVHTDGLPLQALGHTAKPFVARPRSGALVYVQPMDEQDADLNEGHMRAAIESCQEHGHRLQMQMHKSIGLA